MAQTETSDELQGPGSFQLRKGVANIHRLMKWLAARYPDQVIVSYPNQNGEYNTNLTGDGIDRITAYAASKYAEAFRKLPEGEVTGDIGFGGVQTKIVGMVNISTLGSYITFLALHRLGLSPMLISPRLAESGYAHLLHETGCHCVVVGTSSLDMMRRVQADYAHGPLDTVPMLEDDDIFAALAAPTARVDLPEPAGNPSLVMHTGGTTGLPKSVAIHMYGWMSTLPTSLNAHLETMLCTLPIFHTYGLGTFLRCIRTATTVHLLSPYRPVTASIVWKALDDTKARHLYTVPYVLKFFADVDGGVERLAQLSSVAPGGSATPDDLGDELIKAGVKFSIAYGQTESGIPMIQAGNGLDEWKWLTPVSYAENFIKFEKVGDNMYHLVLLPGFVSLKMSDRPDGSYGSKDLFQPHPDNLPGNDTRAGKAKWKFIARQGDIIVLVNGENADPTPTENAVMLEPTVQMVVAFGAGHERPGLLVIPSEKAAGMSREEVIRSIQPALERANKLAADYAKISVDDIIVKPVGTEYPQTAKMTLQRPVLNALFAKDIEAHYAARERANPDVELSEDDVRAAVRRIVETEFKDRVGGACAVEDGEETVHFDDDTDFFSLGMDSLQSSLVRRRLLQAIPLPAEVKLATNVVFEHPTVKLLSEHLESLRKQCEFGVNGSSITTRDPETISKAMVQKYSKMVTSSLPSSSASLAATKNGSSGQVIVLTGATGYIGAQLLNNLLKRSDVSLVYCLVRTRQLHDHNAAAQRVHTALDSSRLSSSLTGAHLAKLRALSADLAAADLGLEPEEYGDISSALTSVIHNAWAVNFNMSLESFEPNVASVAHLLNLARAGSQPTTFVFISSVASVSGAAATTTVRRSKSPVEERLYSWTDAAPFRGYGQSKWVGEQVCAAAAEAPHSHAVGLGSVRVLRVGQVSGDTQQGVWNPAEAIPAMVQSALAIGALPRMADPQRNVLRWLPSDTTAAVIVELTRLELERRGEPLAVFHVASPHTLRWNEDVLPAMEGAGVEFRAVPQQEWVQMLSESDKNVETNPSYKLIEHFRQTYGTPRQESSTKGKGSEKHGSPNGVDEATVPSALDLKRSLEYSPSLKSAPLVDHGLLVQYGQFWSEYWAQKK